MPVEVKICGLRTTQALDAALDAGAAYFGLVFYPDSPRNVDIEKASQLAEHGRGRAQGVALLVNPGDAFVREVAAKVRPDHIQLHGEETPARVAEIGRIAGLPVIKAVRIADAGDVAAARAYGAVADILLYDAKPLEDAPGLLPGGNGVPFDWRALTGLEKDSRFMLSGGLDPDNVRAAIEATGAPMVDVSSGVESAPGVKDPELIRRFIAAAKSARTRD